jgi:hypothetical protein
MCVYVFLCDCVSMFNHLWYQHLNKPHHYPNPNPNPNRRAALSILAADMLIFSLVIDLSLV